MNTDAFLSAYGAAHADHAISHNELAGTSAGAAAGLLAMPTSITDAKAAFCADFPPAYAALKRYSGLLSMAPYIGKYVPTLLAAMAGVNATVVPTVCGASVAAAPAETHGATTMGRDK